MVRTKRHRAAMTARVPRAGGLDTTSRICGPRQSSAEPLRRWKTNGRRGRSGDEQRNSRMPRVQPSDCVPPITASVPPCTHCNVVIPCFEQAVNASSLPVLRNLWAP